MGHSFTNLLYHLVFSTKERHPWLAPEVRAPLFPVMSNLIREERGIPFIVNGVADHVHLLVKLKQDVAVADVLRALKAKSSGWIHKKFAHLEHFAWQTGYGAFTVSQSQKEQVHEYIRTQEEHHRTNPYRKELLALLRANDIDFDEEKLWD